MLVRILVSLLPAFLALAFLTGVPAYSAGDERSAISATKAPRSVLSGALRDDPSEFFQNQWVTEVGPPDPAIRHYIETDWLPNGCTGRSVRKDEFIRPSHPVCAAPARAPPLA